MCARVFRPSRTAFCTSVTPRALCIDFGIAEKYGGKCNLRFDDTNPTKEDAVFVENIQNDIEWLGFSWDELHFASDFFEKLYEIACDLIRKGVAYVDDQTSEEMRKNRGTLTKPGVNSPYRDRSVEENLDLFKRMRDGEFPDGSRVLRAKIDMASPNVLMRDPTLYRILRCHHHRTGDNWCIYPMYDFQHPLQDAIEGITHSLCSLEYEIHRPLYDWVVREAGFEHPPRQIEFCPPQPHPHGDVQAPPAPLRGGGRGRRLGRSPHAHPSPPCAAAVTAPPPSRISSAAWAWPRPIPRWIWPCSNTACARIWAAARRAPWLYSIPSR